MDGRRFCEMDLTLGGVGSIRVLVGLMGGWAG